MKPLNWVELTRQQIKARHGFGWSIQGIEKQNKVITKIVYRFSNGQRSTVITDIEWNTNNSKKIQDLIIELEKDEDNLSNLKSKSNNRKINKTAIQNIKNFLLEYE